MTPSTQPTHATQASLMGKVPITLFMRNGSLKLEDGRLEFATKKKVVFDHPVAELHSVGPVSRVGMRINTAIAATRSCRVTRPSTK